MKDCIAKHGADINGTDNPGNKAPLVFACERKFTEIVKFLLSRSDLVKVNIIPNPLALACTYFTEYTDRRRQHTGGRSYSPKLELVQLLLSHPRLNVNASHEIISNRRMWSTKGPFSALHAAVRGAETQIVKLLLEDERMDPTLVDSDGVCIGIYCNSIL